MAELGALLQQCGLEVAAEYLPQLETYLDELLRWNQRINLTAIKNRDEALEKHLCDALTLLPLLRGDERLLDLGSGAGLPGIPLSIVLPALEVVSVDAVEKKIMFQRHASRLLRLQHFSARHARAEDLPGAEAPFDVIVSRAFAALPDFARLALPVLRNGGRLVAMKGPEGEGELATALPLLEKKGLLLAEVRRLTLPRTGGKRLLIVLQKG
jgi:16S rRNA (guanine527-N7)-methyltransferase